MFFFKWKVFFRESESNTLVLIKWLSLGFLQHSFHAIKLQYMGRLKRVLTRICSLWEMNRTEQKQWHVYGQVLRNGPYQISPRVSLLLLGERFHHKLLLTLSLILPLIQLFLIMSITALLPSLFNSVLIYWYEWVYHVQTITINSCLHHQLWWL